MTETHPIKPFIPKGAKYLILGSFPGKVTSLKDDWYYGTIRTQFWIILENVYGVKLITKNDKIALFEELKIAITDIIKSCERKKGNNLDSNLTNLVYNTTVIDKILKENKIKKIFFSSRFVEKKFKKLYKNVKQELITLPSPSPRYAKLSLIEKIKEYKKNLPSY